MWYHVLEDRPTHKDNTVGSRLTIDECAYIAGFLDGDGSLMFQIKKRKDIRRGWRFMVTVCLYQDTRHAAPLSWMRRKLGIGYLSHRKDGITELRINGFQRVRFILHQLNPFIRFKKTQATVIYRACELLARKPIATLTKKELDFLCRCLFTVQEKNYTSTNKKTMKEIRFQVGLTP